MATLPSIADIMTKNVVAVTPDTLVIEAAELFSKHNINGVPVIDKDRRLVGILTEYDLLTKGAALHLPTFIKLLGEFKIHKNDKSLVRDDLQKIVTLTVADVMNDDPLTLSANASLEEAVLAFAEHHRVNPIPIVNASNHLTGIISRFDVIKFYSPFRASTVPEIRNERDLDKKMNTFLNAFEKKFILVSRFRNKYWLLFSLLFLVVGFFFALFLFGRVIFNS
ncbi:MAG: CBS domain-containing protein [Patescibacteria group bacterium]